jgi:hypothetical protein
MVGRSFYNVHKSVVRLFCCYDIMSVINCMYVHLSGMSWQCACVIENREALVICYGFGNYSVSQSQVINVVHFIQEEPATQHTKNVCQRVDECVRSCAGVNYIIFKS